MKRAAAVLLAVCAGAFGEDAPATMTKLMVKLESPEIPKDSFAAEAKRMYRAGSRYCRIEENPDLEHGIHGLLIMNEPDVWMINRLAKTARHMVDRGPTFNCRMPIFANAEEIKSAEDVNKPKVQLEFGREVEYFRSRSGAPTPGPAVLEEIQRIEPEVKVIVTSAYGQEHLRKLLHGLQASGYIQKPYPLAQVETVLQKCFAEAGTIGQAGA